MINSYYNPYKQDHDLLNNLGTLGATYKLNYDQFKDMGNTDKNSNIGAGFRTGLGILQLASHSYAQKKARQKVVNPYYQTPYQEGGEFDYDTEYEKYYSGNTDVSEQADFSPDEEQAMSELYGGFEKENRIIDEILPMSIHPLVDHFKQLGITPSSVEGGTHNPGSLHGQGKAVDVGLNTSFGGNYAKMQQFKQYFESNPEYSHYELIDETTKPNGQEVWSGPHYHIQLKR